MFKILFSFWFFPSLFHVSYKLGNSFVFTKAGEIICNNFSDFTVNIILGILMYINITTLISMVKDIKRFL